MFRAITTFQPIFRKLAKPQINFSSKSYLLFEQEKANISSKNEPSDFSEENVLLLESDLTESKSGSDSVTEPETNNLLNQENANYDPDWYVYSEEDDLPIPQEAKSFTPRWLKSSQESCHEVYNESTITPAKLSESLFQKFFTEQRASDFVYIDVSGNCNWASAMIIAQGQSLRHIRALSETTKRFLKACQPFDCSIPDVLTLEGVADDEWIVLDAGKSILHFMTEKARETYKLEELWNGLHDHSSEILQKLSETSDSEAKHELLQQLQDSIATSWNQNMKSGPVFESEQDLKAHLER